LFGDHQWLEQRNWNLWFCVCYYFFDKKAFVWGIVSGWEENNYQWLRLSVFGFSSFCLNQVILVKRNLQEDRFITTEYDTQWIGLSLPPLSVINHAALVWFERKSTRNHGFKSQIWCVPCLQLLIWTNFERLITSTEILRDFLKWGIPKTMAFNTTWSFGATIWMAWLVVLLHYASTMRLEWCMLQWSNKPWASAIDPDQ
jgi:hypothetical protein